MYLRLCTHAHIHTHAHAHACTHECNNISNKKGGHGFERELGGVYETIWKEEREGGIM